MSLSYKSEPNDQGKRIIACSECKFERLTHYPIERGHHSCPRASCANLGNDLRLQDCPTCQGHVQIKIFSCSIHRECTIRNKLESVHCCVGCADYRKQE